MNQSVFDRDGYYWVRYADGTAVIRIGTHPQTKKREVTQLGGAGVGLRPQFEAWFVRGGFSVPLDFWLSKGGAEAGELITLPSWQTAEQTALTVADLPGAFAKMDDAVGVRRTGAAEDATGDEFTEGL